MGVVAKSLSVLKYFVIWGDISALSQEFAGLCGTGCPGSGTAALQPLSLKRGCLGALGVNLPLHGPPWVSLGLWVWGSLESRDTLGRAFCMEEPLRPFLFLACLQVGGWARVLLGIM